MQKLIAQQHILFESKIYAPEDEMPTHNQEMVNAWLDAKTAVYVNYEEMKISAEACSRTAVPGLAGDAPISESEDGDNVVGRVPNTKARKKK